MLSQRNIGISQVATAPGDRSTVEGEDETGCRSSVCLVACLVRVCVPFKSNGRVERVHDAVIYRSADIP